METVGYIVSKSNIKTYEVKWDSETLFVWLDTKPISEGFVQIGSNCISKEKALIFAQNFVNNRESRF